MLIVIGGIGSQPALGAWLTAVPSPVKSPEVVLGNESDDSVAEAVYGFMDAVSKTPVRVEKDVSGFIGNRIQMAMTYEAFSLLDQGVASPEAIDRTVKAGFGFRLPLLRIFEKADHAGLDIEYEVEKYLLAELDRGTNPKSTLEDSIEDGELGVKVGRGIYDWGDAIPTELYNQRDRALLSVLDTYREYEMEETPRRGV